MQAVVCGTSSGHTAKVDVFRQRCRIYGDQPAVDAGLTRSASCNTAGFQVIVSFRCGDRYESAVCRIGYIPVTDDPADTHLHRPVGVGRFVTHGKSRFCVAPDDRSVIVIRNSAAGSGFVQSVVDDPQGIDRSSVSGDQSARTALDVPDRMSFSVQISGEFGDGGPAVGEISCIGKI